MLFGRKNNKRTVTKKTSTKKDYVEVTIPKLAFKDSTVSTFWLVVLVVFSFLLGMTYTRLTFLESGSVSVNAGSNVQNTQEGGQTVSVTREDVDSWANDLGLNMNQFTSCMDSEKYADNIDRDVQDAIAAQAEATPTFYINGERVVGALPFASFKEIIDQKLQDNTVGILPDLISSANAQTDTTEEPLIVDVSTGHLPPLGDPDAPVTIVEFSDFECPYCKSFFDTTQTQIVDQYINSGDVVMYYRHLPLEFHPMARTFANASECANEQDKFWEMHDKIFEEQG